jgi:formamidopyrimidine-DNA glycosylase
VFIHIVIPPSTAMPELPEVEVTRRGFADRMTGARIDRVRLGKPLRWPLGCAPETLEGARVVSVGRRGKLHDPRRFGAVVWVPDLGAPMATKLLGGLGPEPLTDGFDPQVFVQALRGRSAAIKQVLLAGDLVVGVGNIYASEALFLAGIRPTCRADRVGKPRALRLHAAIREVLSRALALGGSTLRDFSGSDGQSGYFQMDASVYGREGLPCRVCGTAVRQIRQGQRSTFFCPVCQPR